MLKYHILCLKEIANDNLVWWRSENKGYTSFLDEAGLYTEEQILNNLNYYNNNIDTVAIPVLYVDIYRKTIVPVDSLSKLIKISTEYINHQMNNNE